MESRVMWAGAALAAVLAAGQSAMADQWVRPSSEPEVQGTKAEQQPGGSEFRSRDGTRRGWRNVRGDIERIKRVALRGGPEGDHLVALVNDRMGHRMIVDLGPAKQYREAPLFTGDQIAVRGPIAWISDRKVLLAQRASIDGRMVNISRDRTVDARQLDRSASGQQSAVTGRIERAKELRLRGVDRQHVVVRLKTDEGRVMLADLGTPQDLSRVSLDEGCAISVEGPIIQVNGKPLILAKHLTADGKTVQIDRDTRSVMPALYPGESPGRQDQRASADSPQAVSGEIVVRGEVFKADRDGFVVRDESGKDTYLMITPDVERQGLQIGDRVTAQVKPDGTVVSLNKQ